MYGNVASETKPATTAQATQTRKASRYKYPLPIRKEKLKNVFLLRDVNLFR